MRRSAFVCGARWRGHGVGIGHLGGCAFPMQNGFVSEYR